MTDKLNIQYGDPKTLVPNDWNPNQMSAENEQKLFASMDEGEFKPLIVRELESGTLEILGGEHRLQYYIQRGKEAPYINLGKISDERAKQITVADNVRYGYDDQYLLNEIYRELEDVAVETLPLDEEELQEIMGSTSVDLDDLDDIDDIETPSRDKSSRDNDLKLYKPVRVRVNIDFHEEFESRLNRVVDLLNLEDSDTAINRGEAIDECLKTYLEQHDD